MKYLFLQIPQEAIQASPWNALGYGLLVVVLSGACLALWRELSRERARSSKVANEVIALVTRVGIGFDNDQEFKEEVRQKITKLVELISNLKK